MSTARKKQSKRKPSANKTSQPAACTPEPPVFTHRQVARLLADAAIACERSGQRKKFEEALDKIPGAVVGDLELLDHYDLSRLRQLAEAFFNPHNLFSGVLSRKPRWDNRFSGFEGFRRGHGSRAGKPFKRFTSPRHSPDIPLKQGVKRRPGWSANRPGSQPVGHGEGHGMLDDTPSRSERCGRRTVRAPRA